MEITDEMSLLLDQSNGPIGKLECLEISHPKWAEVYRFQLNSSEDVQVKHEDNQSHVYSYAQINLTKTTDGETLEQEFSFLLGDLGEIIPNLLDAFIEDDEFELPKVSYRAYVIGYYENPIFVSRSLDITGISCTWEGARIDAKAPGLNDLGNGDVYNATDDPSLLGFYNG